MSTKGKYRGLDAEFSSMSAKKLADLKPHKACSIFPPLAEDALEMLTVSISTGGFDEGHPLVIDAKSGELVDGWHRKSIAADIGIDAPVVRVKFPDERAVADYAMRANLGRRHLNVGERRELRRALLEMGKTVKEIAKIMNESQSSVSHALRPELDALKEEKDAKIAELTAAGKKATEIAKAVGVSEQTVVRRQANPPAPKPPKPPKPAPAAKEVPSLPKSNKEVPQVGPAPRFNPECDGVFKIGAHAVQFRAGCTTVGNPVPFEAQLPLAKEVFKMLTAEEKADKVKGQNAISRIVRERYPLAGNGGAKVIALPTKIVDAAATLAAFKIEPKTTEQALGLALDLHQENGGRLAPVFEALAHMVMASFAQHGVMSREDRLKEMMAALAEVKK